MSKNIRIILLAILVIGFIILTNIFKPLQSVNPTFKWVILSALILLSFSTLLMEHFFSKPTDVVASSISILLLVVPIKELLNDMGILYWVLVVYCTLHMLSSIIALLLLNKAKSEECWENKVSLLLKSFSTTFGNGRVLYFLLFSFSLWTYVESQELAFAVLMFLAVFVLIINPSHAIWSFFTIEKDNRGESIGVVKGVQSDNVYLVKLYEDHANCDFLDNVFFRYKDGKKIIDNAGFILDSYYLDDEQWVRVLTDDSWQYESVINDKMNTNQVKLCKDLKPKFNKEIIGLVVENSTIMKIRFYYKSSSEIEEGNLLQIKLSDKTVLYQVVQGNTEITNLNNDNESACIIGEAIQIGVWNSEEKSFDKFGWVPPINTMLYKANNIDEEENPDGYEKIGHIPDTNYPVYINFEEGIKHHIAILGVTGCGKSVFTRDLIRKTIKRDIKVICIDFTNEYKQKLKDLKLTKIICEVEDKNIANKIERIVLEKSKGYKKNQEIVDKNEKDIRIQFNRCISKFLLEDDEIALFELPDVSNSEGSIEFTKLFFNSLFKIAKYRKNYGKEVCVVIEEAHTLIPEWNFVGSEEKTSSNLVNNISQIALQGRKYNIGFIVIAQRTANVSKTVLTQCNSLVVFKEFDNTSKSFVSNYIGPDFTEAIGNLKQRQAIAVGKAFKAQMPMIFQVSEINEPSTENGTT